MKDADEEVTSEDLAGEEEEAEEEIEEEDAEDAEEEDEFTTIDEDLADSREGAVEVMKLISRPGGPDLVSLIAASQKFAEAFSALDAELTAGGDLPEDWDGK